MIVVLDSKTLGKGIDLTVLEQFGQVRYYPHTTKEQAIERLAEATVAISNKVKYTEAILQSCPKLKLIALTATGTNTVDLVAASRLGIKVCNVVNYSTESVVQVTWSMILSLSTRLAEYNHYVHSGRYVEDINFSYHQYLFRELSGKRLGIIGMGHIGRRVAEVGQVFGMTINYYSTTGKNNQQSYQRVDLQTLLEQSDVISIHAPMTKTNKDLLTYDQLCQMKPTGLLINLGRGGIVNEEDLVRALNDGVIAGAGIDVLKREPMTDNHVYLGVKQPEKLLLTPHIGWGALEARQRMIEEVVLNLQAFFEGQARNVVN